MATHKIWFCTGCKKKVEVGQVQEKEVDLKILPRNVPSVDVFVWLLFKKEHPSISKIKFKYHIHIYNKNPYSPGKANFCAGYKDCGPLTQITNFEKVVESQIG